MEKVIMKALMLHNWKISKVYARKKSYRKREPPPQPPFTHTQGYCQYSANASKSPTKQNEKKNVRGNLIRNINGIEVTASIYS